MKLSEQYIKTFNAFATSEAFDAFLVDSWHNYIDRKAKSRLVTEHMATVVCIKPDGTWHVLQDELKPQDTQECAQKWIRVQAIPLSILLPEKPYEEEGTDILPEIRERKRKRLYEVLLDRLELMGVIEEEWRTDRTQEHFSTLTSRLDTLMQRYPEMMNVIATIQQDNEEVYPLLGVVLSYMRHLIMMLVDTNARINTLDEIINQWLGPDPQNSGKRTNHFPQQFITFEEYSKRRGYKETAPKEEKEKEEAEREL